MITVDDIIKWKEQGCPPFENRYIWFFLNIENDLISKFDGENRVKIFLSDYDYKAKLYIVHQFVVINYELGKQLFSLLEIDNDNTFLETKYSDELLKHF